MAEEKPKTFEDEVKTLLEHYKITLRKPDPATTDVLADLTADLFVYGETPRQQERANKSLEILEKLGLIEFADDKPTMKSMRKLIESMLLTK